MADDDADDLDPVICKKITALFSETQRGEAKRILTSMKSSFSQQSGPLGSDRLKVLSGVLKMSEGSLERLARLAVQDWRSILVWSGFQSTVRYREWLDDD
jgi:hypothetical protein